VVGICDLKPDRVLNCVGLRCPEPVLRTRVELDRISADELLEVIADDPAAEADVRSLVKRLGQELVYVRRDGERFHFFIRKTG